MQDVAAALTGRIDVLLSQKPDALYPTVVMAEQTRLEQDWVMQQAQEWLKTRYPTSRTGPKTRPSPPRRPRKKPPPR